MKICPSLINIDEKYLIGSGGYSKVYKIFNISGEPLAVKVVLVDSLSLQEE